MVRLFYFCLVFVLVSCSPPQTGTQLTDQGATYYLVRHAEKTKQPSDPSLTQAGYKRAQDLALHLKEVPLVKIYSSDYTRTRDTAAPIAKDKALSVTLYDPKKLAEFSRLLLTESGHILVVGHSNTTPQLSEHLGGPAGPPIEEATEYNRLYVITRSADGVTSDIQTYGN